MPFKIYLPDSICNHPIELPKLKIIELLNERKQYLISLLYSNQPELIPKIKHEIRLDNDIRHQIRETENLFISWKISLTQHENQLRLRYEDSARIVGAMLNKIDPMIKIETGNSLNKHFAECKDCLIALNENKLKYNKLDLFNWPVDYKTYIDNAKLEGLYSYQKFYVHNEIDMSTYINHLL